MPWSEFQTLLAGLNGDTVLGHMIYVRSTDDVDALNPQQLKARHEWQGKESHRLLTQRPDVVAEKIKSIQRMFAEAYGDKGKGD